MHSKEVEIINSIGLHARPAAEFCGKASAFSSDITIKKLGDEPKEGNAKSLITVMTMALSKGTLIEIAAEGEDEINAVETLVALIESGFGEA
ncbi:HPr family phosphocarrier protein [Acetobacterium bakii]|uniref:Phosphocarrier protein HPr n=1 Tax=Acetobacterium bakii TaxID=52689 RepID=A0A0L6U0D1_9FIRM|nr:HPr family phosphocarrier protein [Acetobacterium bakii]KNZ41959.1 serine kinase [Acetobacterium bakii]